MSTTRYLVRGVAWAFEEPYCHVWARWLTGAQETRYRRLATYESLTAAMEYALRVGKETP